MCSRRPVDMPRGLVVLAPLTGPRGIKLCPETDFQRRWPEVLLEEICSTLPTLLTPSCDISPKPVSGQPYAKRNPLPLTKRCVRSSLVLPAGPLADAASLSRSHWDTPRSEERCPVTRASCEESVNKIELSCPSSRSHGQVQFRSWRVGIEPHAHRGQRSWLTGRPSIDSIVPPTLRPPAAAGPPTVTSTTSNASPDILIHIPERLKMSALS